MSRVDFKPVHVHHITFRYYLERYSSVENPGISMTDWVNYGNFDKRRPHDTVLYNRTHYELFSKVDDSTCWRKQYRSYCSDNGQIAYKFNLQLKWMFSFDKET